MRRKTVRSPKVVSPPGRARQLVRLALLLGVFALAVGYSYDYGRRHALTETPAPGVAERTAAQRILALERERDLLQARVNELTAAAHTDQPSPDPTPQPQSRPPHKATPATDPAPGTQPAPAGNTPDSATTVPGRRLQLTDVRITPTATTGQFRFRFSVHRTGPDDDPVAGNIWIAVDGQSRGTPTRLPLQKITGNRRPYLKMRVQTQQDIDETITLPENFMPRSMLIEAKPFDQRYREATGKFSWQTGD